VAVPSKSLATLLIIMNDNFQSELEERFFKDLGYVVLWFLRCSDIVWVKKDQINAKDFHTMIPFRVV